MARMHTDQARFEVDAIPAVAGEMAMCESVDNRLAALPLAGRRRSCRSAGTLSRRDRASTMRQVSRSSGMPAYW